jgi:phytoene dehydrogenase-like protein
MSLRASYDAVVVGSGPNGLAAAVVLAQAGHSVLLIEGRDQLGGGTRTAALTLPDFAHDVCSAIHPMAALSPLFRSLPLGAHGLEWIHPPSPLAHPFDDGPPAMLESSLAGTASALGKDGDAYTRLLEPFVQGLDGLLPSLLGPLAWPRSPWLLARFGLQALRSARGFSEAHFRTPAARALFAGCAAHAILPFDRLTTAAIGLVLMTAAHAGGWPLPRGGSRAISAALASLFIELGGEIELGRTVRSLGELPLSRAVLLDVTPRQLLSMAGDQLPSLYRSRLNRYRYGPGIFKLDWALDGPIPWKSPACARAATVHLGGSFDAIAAGEAAVWRGEIPRDPFVLLAQQSLFDPTRAPSGQHTGWAYCHVPHGSTVDMTEAIELQVERFAPGFRDRILARHVLSPATLEAYNPNNVGGDITGGVTDLGQLFTRPLARWVPYATPLKGVYFCSSSTPPGAGVHGMCGYHAARAALRQVFGQRLALPSASPAGLARY